MIETRILSSGERCPACKENKVSQVMHVYREPKTEDEMLIFTTTCEKCMFKKIDTMPVQPSHHAKAKRYILTVEQAGDLESKIYRATTASIEVPELEVMLEPGMKADFFITNVEGILQRFKQSCEYLLRDEDDHELQDYIKNKIKEINALMIPEKRFTLILDDHDGFSYILPAREEILHMEQESIIDPAGSS